LIRKNQLEYPRLGLIVSKKCARRAVQRNRIKRQIRESFRLRRATLGNVDIVIMARAAVSAMPNRDIRSLLIKHWTEIGRCAH
jgi:ribonuclease P protein component